MPETIAISARSYKAIARLAVVAFLAIHVFFFWIVRGRIVRGDPDFTAFYTAGRMVREGKGTELYDPSAQQAAQREFTSDPDLRKGPLPYIHPPFEALVFAPLTLLPYASAFVLWNLLNLAMIFAIARIIQSSFPSLQQVSRGELVLACLAFFPIFANFHQGQDAILLLLLFALAFRALGSGAEMAAGCWLGLGLFRYHLAIPAVLILTLWGYRKLLRGFIGVAVVEFIVSVTLTGWRQLLLYPAFTWRWASIPGLGRTPPSLMPSLYGLLMGWPGSESLARPLRIALLTVSAGLLVWAWSLRGLAREQGLFNLSFGCMVILTVLVGFNTSTYDLALLILPVALIADHCLREAWDQQTAFAGLIVPLLPLLISPVWFFLWLRWQRINLLVVFLLWWVFAIGAEMHRMRGARPQAVPL